MKKIYKGDGETQSDNFIIRKEIELFEDVLPHIGDFGKYQWILLLAIIPYTITFCTILYSQIFLTLVPQEYWCKINELVDFNLTQEERIQIAIPRSANYPYYDRCEYKNINFTDFRIHEYNFNSSERKKENTLKCKDWEYNFTQTPYSSISTELNWVCDKEYLISTAQAVFYFGNVLGNLIFGWIADRKGRTVSLMICTATSFVSAIVTANTYTFWTFALCRFISGFTFDIILTIPLTLVMEYVAGRKRTLVVSLTFGVYLSLGCLTVTWVAYFSGNSRTFAYATTIPILFCLLISMILPESVRWYMSKGKMDKVIEKLHRISKVNGKKPDPWVFKEFIKNSVDKRSRKETATVLDILRRPHLAKKTLILSFTYALMAIIFDTHIYFLSRHHTSIFIFISLAALMNIPAAFLVNMTLDNWGRRFCGFLGFILIMVFSFAIVILKSEIVNLIAALLALLCIYMMMNLMAQYIPEFFPTTVRAQGTGLIHILSIFSHSMAPYIVVLASTWRELPMMVTGILGLFAAILILFLPETAGQNLPQTLKDGENFGKGQKFWSLPCLQNRK